MKRGRIVSAAMTICFLWAVYSANQENMDAFQAKRRMEETAAEPVSEDDRSGKDAELAEADVECVQGTEQREEDVEQTEEYAEKEQAMDALPIRRDSHWLTKMVEEQSEVLEGYAAFLREYAAEQKEGGGEKTSVFTLVFLDGDDVPELVVMDGYAHMCSAFVYRFEEGRTIPVGSYGQYGTLFYREKEGIVLNSYDSFGNVYDDVYQIEGSQITHLQSFSERNEISETEGDWLDAVYTVDGKEVSLEQYKRVQNEWYGAGYREITDDMCRTLTDDGIQEGLKEELEDQILMRKDVMKQNVLIAAGAQESDILLFDYDDYDGDGNYEAFVIVGRTYDSYGYLEYSGTLYFAGADGSTLELDESYGHYNMIDGKMEFYPDRKYLFFYTEYALTSNVTELWTVRDGKPVEESELFGPYQVVYRGENEKNEFEVLVDSYSNFYERDRFTEEEGSWWGHVFVPYFWYYDPDSDQIRKYGGTIISKEAFAELSGTNIVEEIEEEGYTVGEIIHWENDIVTINYHYVSPWSEDDSFETIIYKNVIWDNTVKDYWRKDERGVTSWEDAGVGGSYLCGSTKK